MYVGVIHSISDPEGFQKAEARAAGLGLPPGVTMPIRSATPDYTLGINIWKGASVEEVQSVVESVVGPYSENEYFELNVDGLP